MDSSSIAVVVPTIRETHINSFLDAWRFDCRVIVVEDNPERSFQLPPQVDHYAWSDIERDLRGDSWIIPRRSDCVRSYGYWKAYQTGAEYIVTLDDDCLPMHVAASGGAEIGFEPAHAFLAQHIVNLTPRPINRWYSTLKDDIPRGVPYEARAMEMPVGISHGLWHNVIDYDAITQLQRTRDRAATWEQGLCWRGPEYRQDIIPFGAYYPMCGMNLAWRRAYTPLMYFGLQGQDFDGTRYPFDRFGDIWAGILSKKVLDYLGVAVWSGGPFVNHSRASNVWANFDKEHAGIKANETFWQWIDSVRLTADTPAECYRQLSAALPNEAYWNKLGAAMLTWAALYE